MFVNAKLCDVNKDLFEKIKKIDALIASTRNPGERQAAVLARSRLMLKVIIEEPKKPSKPKEPSKPMFDEDWGWNYDEDFDEEFEPEVERERKKLYAWLLRKGKRPDVAKKIAYHKFKNGIPSDWNVFPKKKWENR